ncbi:MAG TPA: carboxypeptidase-like regulatory domain-containing protein, partial [Parafilimonas sp.]
MRKLLFTLSFISVWITALKAQNFLVKGTVVSSNKPVEAATINLLKLDSTSISQKISDKNGGFQIGNLKEGTYFLSVQSVGHKDYFSSVIILNEKHPQANLQSINLEESSRLNDVVVTSEKQYIEQKIDKTV